ncbi:MAG: translation initiation factor IF-3 [Deltaproteobacteria bacterium]|nr:translation initiation factor IF-3 [Deltaproteobacteria bacterium]
MNRPRFDPRGQPRTFAGPRTNHRIRVPEVRVIGAQGEMLGVLPTHEALRLAREADLDLVEVNPKGVPPVCKIMDFGKFKYEEKKKENELKKRQVQVELKEVKLRPKTDDHDLEVKAKHIRRFLEDGNKVKVTCRFRGREITHPETAEVQLVHFIETTKDIAIVEQTPRMEAKTMTILLSPKAEIRARVAAQVAKKAEQDKQKQTAAKHGEGEGDGDGETNDDEE